MVSESRFRKLERVLDRRQPDLTVLMEMVHKPHNFWAVARTCDAVGVFEVHAVLLDEDPAIRDQTSVGTGKWLRTCFHPTIQAGASLLIDRGFQLVAADPSGDAVDYRELDMTGPTALLLGMEKYGLTEEAVALAERRVRIPMEGLGASLNVSVAAAILLYEARRQREAAGLYEQRRLNREIYRRTLFEWAYPEIADYCQRHGKPYPRLGSDGELLDKVT